MAKKQIHTKEELDQELQKDAVLLFKHSSTCPVSAAAYSQFEAFTDNHPDVESVYIVVQEDRDLSTQIAESYHVKHQSPQAILFKNGDVVWHESHWRITADSLSKAIES
ncbi:bacillithiol system redox-active protein YtxJ [Bacillus sp. 1P06AnD]|uniref:bacillithiol system redox-active protein YtxJ n=1 Tax=Bacillus sp. 1P06AnD TaxID=3132208 RepID=UPI00399EF88F